LRMCNQNTPTCNGFRILLYLAVKRAGAGALEGLEALLTQFFLVFVVRGWVVTGV